MINSKLGMMELAATVNLHHGASIAGLDIMDTVGGVIIVGGFKLFFIIVDETNGFVMTDKLDTMVLGIGGDFLEIEIWRGNGKLVINAVL